jgi:hypothetical protein
VKAAVRRPILEKAVGLPTYLLRRFGIAGNQGFAVQRLYISFFASFSSPFLLNIPMHAHATMDSRLVHKDPRPAPSLSQSS